MTSNNFWNGNKVYTINELYQNTPDKEPIAPYTGMLIEANSIGDGISAYVRRLCLAQGKSCRVQKGSNNQNYTYICSNAPRCNWSMLLNKMKNCFIVNTSSAVHTDCQSTATAKTNDVIKLIELQGLHGLGAAELSGHLSKSNLTASMAVVYKALAVIKEEKEEEQDEAVPAWVRYLPNYSEAVHGQKSMLRPPATTGIAPMQTKATRKRSANRFAEALPAVSVPVSRKRRERDEVEVEEVLDLADTPSLFPRDQDEQDVPVTVPVSKRRRAAAAGAGSVAEVSALLSFTKC